MRQTTLCLLVKGNQNKKELLLAMKKRGFGHGKWNGVGGKIKKGDRNISETAIRETEEEIGVKVKDLEKVAVLSFYFPYNQAWNQDVHVFLVKDWQGEPIESEEMLPKWFKQGELPFEQMWEDDRFWLPPVLGGKKVKGKFIFKQGERIVEKDVKVIKDI